MISVTIKKDYSSAVDAFNNELNDYFQQNVEDVRPYLGDCPMIDWICQHEDCLNEETDLTWELGKKTRTGYVASFEPSEIWKETYLEVCK